MAEEWAWLEDGPVFSPRGERRSRTVRVPHGVTLAPIGAGYMGLVAAFAVSVGLAVAGSGLLFDTAVTDGEAVGWWWLVLAVPAVLAAVFTASGVFVEGTERIMKSSTLALIVFSALAGGSAIGLGLIAANAGLIRPWSGREAGEAVVPGTLASLCALATAVLAALAVSSARRARAEVARVLRLRATAPRYAGMITALPDPARWHEGGDVPIRYEDDRGEHTVVVRLNSYAHEIPVPGSRVIVFRDEDGGLHVELDPEHPVRYTPHSRRYDSDTSGGGN
ncbi:hypothetical protein [Microbacterium sp. XT11]|uniref:hypothetical protein n=1 Tax=Microbacterium sp. XT11 TaxID=367477 RepID=UPI000742F89F|nr:hypothetical protein [Microbacterium sp. XT11]ALX65988.1 hypothetical protein AB663_000824 [Microbacterium sp. XT11]